MSTSRHLQSGTTVKPACLCLGGWLERNLGEHCLRGLTKLDWCALQAAVHVLVLARLAGRDAEPAMATAFRLVVLKMQLKHREFAFHAIAFVMEWPDRGRVWALAGLLPLDGVRRCDCEPLHEEACA